ncbi:hypothetical protein EBR96_06880 [bacterium]|nr:hypothetical protein [bacterium]
MYRRVSTPVSTIGKQTISQLNPMAAHRVPDASDPTRSPELTEREFTEAIDIIKNYAATFGIPPKTLSGKMIVGLALNVMRIELGIRVNAAIADHRLITHVKDDLVKHIRTNGLTTFYAPYDFAEFLPQINDVNRDYASADPKTRVSSGYGYAATRKTTISESCEIFAKERGLESDHTEIARWERIFSHVPKLAGRLLEEMRQDLQIDPGKSELTEAEKAVLTVFPTIINAYRAEYAELADAHQTGSRYIRPLREPEDSAPPTHLFFAGHGTVERTLGGQYFPRMGYATMKGTGEGRFLILPVATSKSVSLIVAQVQGSSEMPARKALFAIAENIQSKNTNVVAPGRAAHLETICKQIDKNLPASEQLSSGATIMAITHWGGHMPFPGIKANVEMPDAAVAQGALEGQRYLNIATYGKFPISQFMVEERAYDGNMGLQSFDPAIRSVGRKGGRAIGMKKTGCGNLFTVRTTAVEYGTNFGAIRWQFIMSPDVNKALSNAEITAVADRHRYFPDEKIAQEILNSARAKGVSGHQFAIVLRGNAAPPFLQWKKPGSGHSYSRIPPILPGASSDAFLPAGVRVLRPRRPGEPIHGVPLFAVPICRYFFAIPFGTLSGIWSRISIPKDIFEKSIYERLGGDPDLRTTEKGANQVRMGGMLTAPWGISQVTVHSFGAWFGFADGSIHSIISPDQVSANSFSIGLAPSSVIKACYQLRSDDNHAFRIAGAMAGMQNHETETRVSVIDLSQKTGKATIFGLGDFGAIINEFPNKLIAGHPPNHPASKVFIGTNDRQQQSK